MYYYQNPESIILSFDLFGYAFCLWEGLYSLSLPSYFGSIVKRFITPACHAGVRSSTLRGAVHLQSKFTRCGTDLLSHVILYWDWVSITLLCVTRYVDYSPPPVGIRRWKPYHVTLCYVIVAYHEYKDNRIDSGWKAGSISCLLFCCMSGLVRKRSWKPLVRKGLQVRILCAALWLWQTWQCSGLWFRLIWVRIPLVTFICAFRIIGSTTGSNPVSQSSSLWGRVR